MSSKSDVSVEWVTMEMLIKGAASAKTLDHYIGWSDPNQNAQMYSYDKGYVVAVPRTKHQYYYSEQTVDRDSVR